MKKVLTIILAALIVLLPTIAALVLHFLPDGIVQTPISITGTLYDDDAHYEFDRNNNASLASFFNSLEQSSRLVQLSADSIEFDKMLIAEIVDRSKSAHLTLYLSLNDKCYYSDENGALYEINEDYSDTFLNSDYAISIYEKLHSPTLNTFSNEVVIPTNTNFKYTVKDHSSKSGSNSNITDKVLTYYSSNTSEISFSVTPDICDITVYVNDTLTYKGSLFNFNSSSIPNDATVKYEIDATWIKNNVEDCFGTASYSFYVKYSPAPTFTIDKTSFEAGEFMIIKATDIIDSNRVHFDFSGGLDVKPRFFKNGENYFALLPFSMDLKSGEYKLTVTCGETTKSANITITERNRVESSTVYTLDTPLTEQSLSSMNGLISSIGLNCSDRFFTDTTFINYEIAYGNDFYFKLGYGRIRTFDVGPAFDMIGIEFSASEGIDIPVINNGIVCASGEDAVLGKYIVVDHGYGLKSWYCNISETSLSVGDEVQKGDTIAKTGSSAFYDQVGFYLITTVLDVPVSPYAIYEDNFVLPH